MKRAAWCASRVACLCACSLGCSGGCGKTNGTAADAAALTSARVDGSVPPRCTIDGAPLALEEGDRVGGAAIGGDELAVGVVRPSKGHRVHGVVIARADLGSSRFVELGPAEGDEPPPEPAYGKNGPFVVAYYMHNAGDAGGRMRGRTMGVMRLADPPSSLGDVAAQADESYDYDLGVGGAGALVAWDEDAPSGDRGLVKVATVGGAPPEQPSVISLDASDAESPRVVARAGAAGGYWVAWASSRVEPLPDGSDRALEGPGELRKHRWIEAVSVDASGKPAGAPLHLTPASGHAGAFAVAARGDDFLIAVTDEDARLDGAGGRVRGIVVRGDGASAAADSAIEIVPSGVGRASIDLVGARDRWSVAYTDEAERVHLAPWLGAGGPLEETVRRESAEPAFESGRVLASDGTRVYALALDVSAGGRAVVRKLVCP